MIVCLTHSKIASLSYSVSLRTSILYDYLDRSALVCVFLSISSFSLSLPNIMISSSQEAIVLDIEAATIYLFIVMAPAVTEVVIVSNRL